MRLNDARCFVFDFDGTLAPNLDLPGMRQGVVELTLAQGVPAEEFKDCYIIEIIHAAHTWLRVHQATEADGYHQRAHKYIVDFELTAAARLEPFPAVRPLLQKLREQKRRTAVVTRNCEQAVRNTFPDIDDHLDLLLARDNVEHIKPDPRHLGRALRECGELAGHSVMVGDGRMDMRLGSQLGLTCVGVLTGSSNSADLRAAGAQLVLDHISELICHL